MINRFDHLIKFYAFEYKTFVFVFLWINRLEKKFYESFFFITYYFHIYFTCPCALCSHYFHMFIYSKNVFYCEDPIF